MTEFKMLGEIIHYCTKCKLNLNHRITLMGDKLPKKILCLTCNSERQYRVDKPKTGATRRVAGVKAAPKVDLESEWRAKLANKDKTPKPYPDPSPSYRDDDLIYHKAFGLGLVVNLIPPDKMRIYFDDGLKILKQSL